MGKNGSIDDASIRLHSVAIRLLRRARISDRDAAVGPAQLSALSVLYFAEEPVAVTALASAEQVAQPTMSRIIGSLAAAGAVSRTSPAGDKRVQLIRISAKGRRIFEAARERRLEVVRDVVGRLSPSGLSALETAMDELAAALSDS